MKGKVLNPQQKMAVEHGKGPLLIIAGAGTGKTTVITQRIVHLISSKLANPNEILALTFTEKAAREMEERVDIAMPYGVTQMWISTFHQFCDRILRTEGLQIGLDPNYNLMSEAETIQLVRNNIFNLDLKYFRTLGNPTKFVEGLIRHFARLQDEDITAMEYSKWVSKQKTNTEEQKLEVEKYKELSKAYKQYEELKIKHNAMDYGDLIVKTLKLFRDRPNILKNYQNQFKYILVDEFQDTNYSQSQLVYLLAGKRANLTVVGDDDQSIYRFRGAAFSNIVQFRKKYSKSKLVVLTRNYRSNQEILDKAYDLINHNNPDRLEAIEGINKKLVSDRKKDHDRVRFMHLDRVENEAEAVAKRIKELVKSGKYKFSDSAVLVRANNHADSFVRAFQRAGLPHQFLGPGKLFNQPEVSDLVAFLRVVSDPDDSASFYQVLSIPEFDFQALDLRRLVSFTKSSDYSIFESLDHIEESKLSDDTKERLKKFQQSIKDHIKLSAKQTAGQVLFSWLESNDLLSRILNPDTPTAEKRAKNIAKFFDKIKSYESEHEDASVNSVVDWIDLASNIGESPLANDSDWSEVNAVNIMTVHGSKGLEFPVVFLVNLVALRFPSMQRREQIPLPESIIKEVLPTGDFHLQEERRLFYVGMTRAKDYLFLTAADFYTQGRQEKKISPFVFESLGEQTTKNEHSVQSSEQLSLLDFATQEEKQTKPEKFHIDYLSYSQIQTFQICPLHYKLRYVVGLPPVPTAAQSLGISVHNSMHDFYAQIKAGEKPTEKLILNLLDKNWISQGYKNKKYERISLTRAKDYLLGFLKKGFDEKVTPVLLEQKFSVSLNHKGNRPLQIGGVIDRVDQFGNNRVEIIDYKTGENVPSQREVDKNEQLTFYALAASKISDPPFGRKPEDISLSLYYFEEQTKLTTKRTIEQLADFEKKLFEIRKEIENSDFQCNNEFLCKDCEYAQFCKRG